MCLFDKPHSVVSYRNGLMALLAALCFATQAQEQLSIAQPAINEVLSSDRLLLEIQLEENGRPLAGETLSVTTDFGMLHASDTVTDSEGKATLELYSSVEGAGTVRVTSQAGTVASRDFTIMYQDGQLMAVSPGIIERPPGPLAPARIPLLEFLSPPVGIKIETGVSQAVWLKYTISGVPQPGQPIQIWSMAQAGSLMEGTTDEEGIARFMVRSNLEVESRLEARAGTVANERDIEFIDPETLGSPFNGRFKMISVSSSVELLIQPDQIGFLAKHDVTYNEISEMALALDLTIGKPIGGGIFVLQAREKLSQNTRWMLARNLWSSGRVRAAGLVATMAGTSHSVVIDEMIYVRFKPPLFDDELAARLAKLPVIDVQRTPYGINEFTLRVDSSSAIDPLEIAMGLASRDDVVYAHPDIAQLLDIRSSDTECDYQETEWPPWCDDRYKDQWHLENTGQGGALKDADADVREAWKFTRGSPGTLIAVIDISFYLKHPDLEPNLWTDPGDSDRRGIDLVDDEHSSLLFSQPVGSGSYRHGTNVAGLAAASSGKIGWLYHGDVVGVCPECQLLPIRVPKGIETGDMKGAFQMASEYGADVISMSLGILLTPENISYDIDQLVNQVSDSSKDSVMVFAMSNEERENCMENPDSASLESVIAVGGITDWDTKSYKINQAMGFGDCMDILAPSRGGNNGISTSNVILGSNGEPKPHIIDNFGGTSAATPQVAGIAALVLDVSREEINDADQQQSNDTTTGQTESQLTPLQVQMILQDTADKVEPDLACYDPESGFSDPCEISSSTHGYGRVNAFEAVRLVAPDDNQGNKGKDNKDLLLRDHALDWGNTEQPSDTIFSSPKRGKIEVFQSADIKIDVKPYQVFNLDNPQVSFRALQAEDPVSGTESRVYVRVHNRGQEPVTEGVLKLHWVVYEDDLPELPGNIWDSFPAPDSASGEWQTLASETVYDIAYSGASVAGCPGRSVPVCLGGASGPQDKAQVIMFEAPDTIMWDATKEQLAWLAVIDSEEDHVQAKLDFSTVPSPTSVISNVVMDNNITLWTTVVPVSAQVELQTDELPSNEECPTWLQILLVMIVLLVLCLLAYIMYYLWVHGGPLPHWLILFFLLAIIFLVSVSYLYIRTEGCC